MKRQYKIAHYPRENERAIFRENGETKQWLSSQRIWTRNERYAGRYLHESDCISALSIIKFSKGLKTEEEYIEEKIQQGGLKQSWGELSSS